MRASAISAVVLLALPLCVGAVSTSNTPAAKSGTAVHGDLPDGREGGETMADAALIPSLPYSDTGSTVGHVNDYDEMCPWGSNSPDVVYKYVPDDDTCIMVDLCSSLYDTKVYVFEDTPYNTIACSDDAGCGYSGYQSRLGQVEVQSGHAYYIVVDGYGGDAGSYVMVVVEVPPPCVIECPPGALVEDEPWCEDDFEDVYNSGCSTSLFDDIPPAAPGSTISLCGTSGTYLYHGASYRDTDWFQLTLPEEQTVQFCCRAEFPLLVFFIYNADCANMQYEYATADPCDEVCLSRTAGPGIVWLWVGPQVFQGIPCGWDYLMTIEGYESTSAVESRTWGTVKAMYR